MDPIGPVRFRMSDITYAEFIDAMEAAGIGDLTAATTAEQMRSTVALGWAVARRTRPLMTYEDALAQPMGTFVAEEEAPAGGEGSGATGGVTPPASVAPGPSTR
jgi:hypothetical protein